MGWQGIAKGTGLFVAGIIVGTAGASPSPQQSASISQESNPTVLGTKVAPSNTVLPTPSATSIPATPAPTPVPAPTTVVKAATPVPVTQSNCNRNYSGCVPIASDVDCMGGSGNGPAYVRGPVTVIGSDIYRLDSDNDGIACE